MLRDWSRLRRLGLVLSLASGTAALPLSPAWAQDDDDEEEEDEDEGDEEEEEEDEDQPPVTAGGLFTKETYPLAELERPLTITRKMTELRVGLDMDMSAKTAFETWGTAINARHGLEDNVELQLDVRTQFNNFGDYSLYGVDNDLSVTAAVEASIVYDLVDFRLGLAIPYTTSTTTDPVTMDETTTSDTNVDFEVGFPFRYAPKPQVGLIALDTFLTINTSGKPDLTPSVGIIVQPVEMLAIKLKGKVIIPDFDTEASAFAIPVSADLQFSPSNKLDIGLEFTFPNLKPFDPPDPDGDGEMPDPEPAKFTDSRFLLLYGQIRI